MKLFLMIPILMLFVIKGNSQINSSIKGPLDDYFQRNYDSTIIVHYSSAWGDRPDYFFIAKRFDTIYYYHYFKPFNINNDFDKVGPQNSHLHEYFQKRFEKNSHSFLSGYNEFDVYDDSFFWVFTEVSKGSLWEKIQSENIWNFVDSHNEKFRINEIDVEDGPISEYKLITYDKLVALYYKSPELYPINKQNHIRNRIVEIDKLMYGFFSKHKINFKF